MNAMVNGRSKNEMEYTHEKCGLLPQVNRSRVVVGPVRLSLQRHARVRLSSVFSLTLYNLYNLLQVNRK